MNAHLKLPEPVPFVARLERLGDDRLQFIVGTKNPSWTAYVLALIFTTTFLVSAVAIFTGPLRLAAFALAAGVVAAYSIKDVYDKRSYLVLALDRRSGEASFARKSRSTNRVRYCTQVPLDEVRFVRSPVRLRSRWSGECIRAEVNDHVFILACGNDEVMDRAFAELPEWIRSNLAVQDQTLRALGDVRLISS